MKYTKRIIVGSLFAFMLSGSAFALATAATPPALPAEQQALLNNGYKETASWGKFEKQAGACHMMVELSGKNYYVTSTGKLAASLYPVRPSHVVDGATFAEANCQG
jgi:hypothetical protein